MEIPSCGLSGIHESLPLEGLDFFFLLFLPSFATIGIVSGFITKSCENWHTVIEHEEEK